MRDLTTWLCCAAASLAPLGCDDAGRGADEDADRAVTLREVQTNGIRLNGIRLNGIRLNGIRLNGVPLNGDGPTADYIEVLGYELPGLEEVADGWIEGSNLHVKTTGGWVMHDWDLEDSVAVVTVKEGGVIKQREVWIKYVDELGSGSGIWAYDIDVRDDGGPWQPLCTDDAGVRTRAILLSDVWTPSGARLSPRPSGALTFACRGAALAKCVEFGYAPWRSKNGVSLADHHQACTRMLRADYCGNGTAHTVPGVPVHVLDPLAIQKLDASAKFVVEAEWGPGGATCLNSKNTRLPGQAPGCSIPACGAAFASGGLLQSGKLAP